jgi:hypothetical protein
VTKPTLIPIEGPKVIKGGGVNGSVRHGRTPLKQREQDSSATLGSRANENPLGRRQWHWKIETMSRDRQGASLDGITGKNAPASAAHRMEHGKETTTQEWD